MKILILFLMLSGCVTTPANKAKKHKIKSEKQICEKDIGCLPLSHFEAEIQKRARKYKQWGR